MRLDIDPQPATSPLDAPATSRADAPSTCRSPLGTYAECPLCGSDLFPEHAHFRCTGCGWRDSCCD
jgi:hypothetical protein